MKSLISLGIMAFTWTQVVFAQSHSPSKSEASDKAEVSLSTTENSLKAGPVVLRIQLKQNEKALGKKDIAISHTQRVHAFLVDHSLTQFRHEHPEWDGKDWVLKTNLEKGGNYKLWIQAKVASSGDEVTLSKRIQVEGTPSTQQPFSQNLLSESDGVVVKLSSGSVKSGEQSTLKFSVTRRDGSKLKLEPYLGAAAHVVAIHEKNEEMAHMHPLNEEAVSPFETHAAFEKPGFYRIWAQFREDGKLLTVPFTLQVAKGATGKMPMDHSKH